MEELGLNYWIYFAISVVLFVASELIGASVLKSNSVVELIINVLKMIKEAVAPKK